MTYELFLERCAGPERPSSGPESAGHPAATGSVAPFLGNRDSV
jgi:hypothetical protein